MKSKSFTERIANGIARLWTVVKIHPVEILILLHAAIATVSSDTTKFEQPAPYAAIATMVAFCLSRFRGSKAWVQWLYFAILPIYALTAFFPIAWPETSEFAIVNFLLPAVYLLTLPTQDNARFTERFYRFIRSVVIAIGVVSILLIILWLINASVEILFGSDFRNFGDDSAVWCYIFLAPLLFIALESRKEQPKVIRLVEGIINYVFTPALLIYNLILYAYLALILVKWELPKGSVSTMVMSFVIVAVVIRLVRPLLAKRPLVWYFRWFALFALPLVALFWVAVGYRLHQYGLTIDRCLLFVSGALMTLYLIGSVLPDAKFPAFNYCFTALVVLCGVVLVVGGPLSARQVSLRSQAAIVREKAEGLGILTSTGTIDTAKFRRTDADTVNREEHRAIYQAMKYMEKDLADTTAVRTALGMTSAEYLDRLSRSTAKCATSWQYESYYRGDAERTYYLFCYKKIDLDISGYSRMVVDPDVKRPVQSIPYPGGSIPADTLLATQLAKIGYALNSNLDNDRLQANECALCHYESPDGKVLIIFGSMNISRNDSINRITDAQIRCALVR